MTAPAAADDDDDDEDDYDWINQADIIIINVYKFTKQKKKISR